MPMPTKFAALMRDGGVVAKNREEMKRVMLWLQNPSLLPKGPIFDPLPKIPVGYLAAKAAQALKRNGAEIDLKMPGSDGGYYLHLERRLGQYRIQVSDDHLVAKHRLEVESRLLTVLDYGGIVIRILPNGNPAINFAISPILETIKGFDVRFDQESFLNLMAGKVVEIGGVAWRLDMDGWDGEPHPVLEENGLLVGKHLNLGIYPFVDLMPAYLVFRLTPSMEAAPDMAAMIKTYITGITKVLKELGYEQEENKQK